MANPLSKAIKSAVRMNADIGGLFADIGTNAHPRGYIQTAYRNASRNMAQALQSEDRLGAANEVLALLRRDVQIQTIGIYGTAQGMGAEESARQLSLYGIQTPSTDTAAITLSRQSKSALEVTLTKLDAQAAAIRALILTDAEDGQILGDDNRAGVLTPGDVAATAAAWAASLVWNSFDSWTRRYQGELVFQKQAIAALDGRTTNCCLEVHAQIQPMDKPFRLTGTPRFADYMDWPGFHGWCRTSGVLYLAGFDDGLTSRMRDSADWFLDERKAGRNPDRNPADAFE